MDVRNCKKCGTLFNFVSGLPLCPSCIKGIEDKFSEVKQYIYDHPGAGIHEVSEAIEIPTVIIKKWVKEERLAFAEGSAIGVECERCGKMILTGRFCDKCKDNVKNEFGSLIKPEKKPEKKPKPDANAKMRFLN